MPKYLSCPEIARRMGYSRMQVARWAKNNMIPGSRIITQGYHYRYELTPTLAAWIRIRRRKGRERHMGLVGAVGIDEQGNRVVPCEIICEEINELISEIVRRIGDISPPNPTPTPAQLRTLDERLAESIDWLGKTRDSIHASL